jgi:hypothetical protein
LWVFGKVTPGPLYHTPSYGCDKALADGQTPN